MRFIQYLMVGLSLLLIHKCYPTEQEQLMMQTIYLTEGIISRSPEIIKCREGEKIYLDERHIEQDDADKSGGYVCLDSGLKFYLPLLSSDENGFYTSKSFEFWSKLFHQICNKCGYEWEGGLFTVRCPKCKSKDISNIRS